MILQNNAVIATLGPGSVNHPFPDAPRVGALCLDALDHGRVINHQLIHLSLSANNAALEPKLLVAFDSALRETSNPRLEGPNGFDRKKWIGGNIDPRRPLGKLLILQEHGYDADGVVSTWPEAQPTDPAGQMIFDFNATALAFGFDLLGCEGPEAPGLDAGYRLEFFVDDRSVGVIGFSEFVTPGSPWFDARNTVQFGPRSANRIEPIEAERFGVDAFDRAVIHLGGPAALGSFVIETGAQPPDSLRFPG